MPTHQFSYLGSFLIMPSSSIWVTMALFSSTEPSQICKESGWHSAMLFSMNSLTAGARAPKSPCTMRGPDWLWVGSWGGMVLVHCYQLDRNASVTRQKKRKKNYAFSLFYFFNGGYLIILTGIYFLDTMQMNEISWKTACICRPNVLIILGKKTASVET